MAEHAKFREIDDETGEAFFVCTDCVDDWPCVYAKLKVATTTFDEIEADLGKLLGLTRTEMRIEAAVKRARAQIDGEG